MAKRTAKERLEAKGKKPKVDRSNYAMLDYDDSPDSDLSGELCEGWCEYHGVQCAVVMKYNDPKIQKMVETLREIQDTPSHTLESRHYCVCCQAAMRENRDPRFYYLSDEGVVYRGEPREQSIEDFYEDAKDDEV